MNNTVQPIKILEEKIIVLLNKLKENHLDLVKFKDLQTSLVQENKILKDKILIKQVDYCIQQLSEMN